MAGIKTYFGFGLFKQQMDVNLRIEEPVIHRLIILSELDLNNLSGASWNRVLCYSKSLVDSDIEVIITSAVYKDSESLGLIEYTRKIFFLKYEKEFNNKKQLPVIKELYFIKHIKYLRNIFKKFNEYNEVTYLLYPLNFSLRISTLVYLKFLKRKKVFLEKNELNFGKALNLQYPTNIFKKLIFPIVWLLNLLPNLGSDVIDTLFDGIICISTRMEKLYKILNKNIIRIPVLADTNKTDIIFEQKSKTDCFKIAYTGTISEKRDGVFSFLKSIHFLNKEKPRIIVNLYGPVTNSGKLYLYAIIKEYELSEIVIYHGNLPADEIPKILRSHDLLVLPRPLNLQTNYGFSTKLAEYLNSGVPVLSTKISDAELYLTNEKTIYFTDSLKPKDIAAKIDEIINNRSLNIKIAKAAIEAHHKHFNYKNYSDILINFFFRAS